MSTILLNDTTMIDIADAIRSKDGTSEQMLPSEMAGKIGTMPAAEKRIIPTSFIYSGNDGESIAGTGITYLRKGNAVNIDGKSYGTIDGTIYSGGIEYGVPVRFKTSLTTRNRNLPIIIGNETDIKLEGVPKRIIAAYGYLIPDAGISVTGNGYAILYSAINDQIGAITVDGHKISNNLSIEDTLTIRFDFTESFKIAYRDIDSRYSPQWEIVVF